MASLTSCWLSWIGCNALMLIQIETEEEERILRQRFRAVAHTLGPMVDLKATFPDGSALRTLKGGRNSAAQARGIVERLTG